MTHAIERERSALIRAGRLHWAHWLVVAMSVLAAVSAWYFAQHQVDARNAERFERESQQMVDLVSERMRKYEDALWGGVATMHTHGGEMSRDSWRTYARALDLATKYPGINGIGVIHRVPASRLDAYLAEQRLALAGFNVHPPVQTDEHLPITYIEPENINSQAIGLDMTHETTRHAAALRARDTGEPAITGPIVLVQDSAQTPGFLFFAPFYAYSSASHSPQPAARARAFAGLVYAPFVVRKLMAGTLEKSRRHVGVAIRDGRSMLYDEHLETDPDYDPAPLFRKLETVDLYGRTWTFDIRSTRSFRAAAGNTQPLLILGCGLAIDVLLFGLFILLTRANRRAIRFADLASAQLQRHTRALTRSNADLQAFAYATSHDLKTPLRGIATLTEFIEEDLEAHLGSADCNTEVRRNLHRVRAQVTRLEQMISGILDYSQIVSTNEPVDGVDVRVLVQQVCADLAIGAEHIQIENDLPVLRTDPVMLERVFGNLISNARKYHHEPATLRITVAARLDGDRWQFAVADNGPGIDVKFHGRIFEVFQRLQSHDAVAGSGIGLSIVKRILDGLGSSISVSATPGGGATFTFDWPQQWADEHVSNNTELAA